MWWARYCAINLATSAPVSADKTPLLASPWRGTVGGVVLLAGVQRETRELPPTFTRPPCPGRTGQAYTAPTRTSHPDRVARANGEEEMPSVRPVSALVRQQLRTLGSRHDRTRTGIDHDG